MQVNPKLIKNQFEKSFETYSQNAIVQQVMAQKLIEELCKIRTQYKNVLELGSGTGLLTKEAAQALVFEKYYANDLVEKSKKYITEVISNAVFYGGNAIKIKPSKKPDLIISNAMFQWFKNLAKVSEHCKNLLEKDGILAFTTFSEKNFKEIKELTGLSLEYKSLDEIVQILEKDFEILYKEEFTHQLKFNTPLELLAHMKNTGVNSLTSKHLTFKEVKEFCDNYKEKFPEISLTYSPIVIICLKK